MQEDTTVVADTTNGDVEVSKTETAEERVARLEETNKKLYERAKEAETKVKEFKATIKPLQETPKMKIEDEVLNDVKELKHSEKKRQFGYKNNLSPEETDLLFRFAGDKDPSETLKEDDFKDLLEAKRKRTRIANATPSGSSRAATTIEGKTFKEMSEAERAKNWSTLMQR